MLAINNIQAKEVNREDLGNMMNQLCKVCGEPAAGFHFGAFTCEGCKSFFGRTYNNLSSLNECKNSGRCIINKKTRTSCKSCRLRKCLMVGMSKSGSRYGRRSNWFKIHYLMQGAQAAVGTDMQSSQATAMTCPESSSSTAMSSPVASRPPTTSPNSDDFNLESKPQSPEFKGADQRMSHESVSDIRANDDVSLTLDYKILSKPSKSSDSQNNLSFEINDKLFPPYEVSLYSKDFFNMYNLPTLNSRLPSYLSQASLAQRYLYPYFPSLLSMYSRRQYLDSLLKEAGHKENRISPDREFPSPCKILKTSSSHSSVEIVPLDSSKSAEVSVDRKSTSPGLCNNNVSIKLANKPNIEIVSIGASTSNQESPMDLSMKPHGSNYLREQTTDDEDPVSEELDKKSELDIKSSSHVSTSCELNKPDKSAIVVCEQVSPLDLSAVIVN